MSFSVLEWDLSCFQFHLFQLIMYIISTTLYYIYVINKCIKCCERVEKVTQSGELFLSNKWALKILMQSLLYISDMVILHTKLNTEYHRHTHMYSAVNFPEKIFSEIFRKFWRRKLGKLRKIFSHFLVCLSKFYEQLIINYVKFIITL